MARKHHSTVAEIDNALGTKDHKTLCNLMCIEECEQLIGESLRSENGDDCPEFSAEGLVNVENDVQIKYSGTCLKRPPWDRNIWPLYRGGCPTQYPA